MFLNTLHKKLENEKINHCASCERSFHRHGLDGCFLEGQYQENPGISLCQDCYYGWVRNKPELITFSIYQDMMKKSGFNPEVSH